MSINDRSYSEKRDFIRMTVDTKAILKVGGQRYDAICRDLSSTGLQLEAPTQLVTGDKVVVEIPSTHAELKGLEVEAEVTRVQADSAGKQVLGLTILVMR